MDSSEPIDITAEMPKQITVLQSAINALEMDNSKTVHLTPGQAKTLRIYIKDLECSVPLTV